MKGHITKNNKKEEKIEEVGSPLDQLQPHTVEVKHKKFKVI